LTEVDYKKARAAPIHGVFSAGRRYSPGNPGIFALDCPPALAFAAIRAHVPRTSKAVDSIPPRLFKRAWRPHRPAVGAKKKEQAMVNKLELVEHIAAATDTSKAASAAALDAVIEGITKALKKGEEVRLVGFGTFSVKKRAAGKGRNPATGEEIKIPASKSARFKSGATLKAALNKK